MKKVTIRDVAKAAKVSYVTVSNVINSTGRMSEKTKNRVLKVIEKMDFHPDLSARILARGKSDAIAFVSSYLSSPFVIGVLSGVERRIFETDKMKHRLEHYATHGATELKDVTLKNILYGKKADAVIMLTIKPDIKLMKQFKERAIPVILVENSTPGAHSVRIDNYRGSYDAVDYLVKKGRKKIVYISGPMGPSAYDEEENPVVMDRFNGYKDALKDNGIEFDQNMVFPVIYFNQEEGMRIMELLRRSSMKADAIFSAAGDMVALGILYQAKKYGIKIPEDISLVGFDDVAVASVMTPPLTTVRQPMDEMGRVAFDLAVKSLDDPNLKTQTIILKPELIIREST